MKNRASFRPRSRSLGSTLMVRVCIILLSVLLLSDIGQYLLLKNSLYSSAEALLQSRLHNLSIEDLIALGTPDQLAQSAPELISRMIDTRVNVTIISQNGEIIADSDQTYQNQYIFHLLPSENNNPITNAATPKLTVQAYLDAIQSPGINEDVQYAANETGERFMLLLVKVGSIATPSGLIQLSQSLTPIEDTLNQQLIRNAIMAAVVLILGLLLLGGILIKTLKPLHQVTETLAQIHSQQLDIRLPEDNGQREVDQLAAAFNDMLQRIDESFKAEEEMREKMRHFVSDASHELRSPLTAIHGFAEVLSMGAAKDEEQLQSSLAVITSETERLTKLVNDLLLLTRLDHQADTPMQIQDLGRIIQELEPQLRLLGGERQLHLSLQENLHVLVNRDQIKQVIINLVQNAFQHTADRDGLVTISLESVRMSDSHYALIKVSDNGSGISTESLPAIFDRFYRETSHRSRKQGGYGLGLSIVKSIVEAHDGEITVSSEVGKGTTFSIYLQETTVE